MNREFREAVDSLHPAFERLITAPAYIQGAKLPEQGVYLFRENGNAMYIGRSDNIRCRYGHHTRPGSPTNAVIPPTVSHMFGEIVWLLTQSPAFKHLALSDLEWLVMPPLLLEQYRVFRDGARPVGVALWAHLSEEAERKLTEARGRLRPDEWKSGNRLWLVELIAPFATAENQMVGRMLTDLAEGVFKGKVFRLIETDPASGTRKVLSVGSRD
jgi:cytolysin-activating lysine-acyltransferase